MKHNGWQYAVSQVNLRAAFRQGVNTPAETLTKGVNCSQEHAKEL